VKRLGCVTLFAAYYHELTALEHQGKGVVNCHVLAISQDDVEDEEGNIGGCKINLTFLYEVKPGACLESFGIQVAEMAQLPKSVIEDAKKKAKGLETFESSSNRTSSSSSTGNSLPKRNLTEYDAHAVIAAKAKLRRIQAIPLQRMSSDEKKMCALR